MHIKTARSGRVLGSITGALLALSLLVDAPDARAEEEPPTGSVAPAAGAVAIQGGFSGLAKTIEGEGATSWGLVVGFGMHMTPDETAPTARLAFDHAFGQTRHQHLRAGVRVYGFSESPTSATCSACTLLVPEIGYRFTSEGGFVFEIGEPLGRLNLSRVRADGFARSFASDGYNGFLVTILIGYSHAF
jgi:hypothetical protein